MSTTIAFARSSAWAHRSSLLSGSITLFLAALLLSATGTWIQSGISLAGESDARGDIGLLSVASSFAGTTVLVVIVIVASVLTQSLRPRAGQLTLLRTIGATPKQIRRLVITEVLFVFALSTPLGIVAGSLLAPRVSRTLAASGLVPPGFEPASSPTTAFGVLCVLGGTVILSSLLAVRSVTRQSAAEAKRASTVESGSIGRSRRVGALVLAGSGIASACAPLVVGGIAGSAGAASSAILFVIAIALAGPVLVSGAARLTEQVVHDGGRPVDGGGRSVHGGGRPLHGGNSPAFILAVRAARGHSRRLTGAIVPLALLFALGLVQIGSGAIGARAGQEQLESALRANLVIEASASQDLAVVENTPGVQSAGVSAQVMSSVRTDADEPTGIGFIDDLSWESAPLTVFAGEEVLAPNVTDGSLAELDDEDTVAISTDSATMLARSVGETLEIEAGDDQVVPARIVATYEGGAAIGDYLVGSNFPGAASAANQDILIATDDGAQADVAQALRAKGMSPIPTAAYVADVQADASGEQSLSTGATLLLLIFIGLAAVNTLVMITRSRGREFRLLRQTGITSHQLVAMALIEGTFVGVTAVCLGALSAVPALFGISWAMVDTVSIGVGPGVVLTLTAVVIGIGIGSVVPATYLLDRGERRSVRPSST